MCFHVSDCTCWYPGLYNYFNIAFRCVLLSWFFTAFIPFFLYYSTLDSSLSFRVSFFVYFSLLWRHIDFKIGLGDLLLAAFLTSSFCLCSVSGVNLCHLFSRADEYNVTMRDCISVFCHFCCPYQTHVCRNKGLVVLFVVIHISFLLALTANVSFLFPPIVFIMEIYAVFELTALTFKLWTSAAAFAPCFQKQNYPKKVLLPKLFCYKYNPYSFFCVYLNTVNLRKK